MTLAIPRLAFRQHSPRRRLCRRSPTLTARNISSMRAKPMKLLGLNLTIPFAVRSGGCCFRLSLFRLSFSLACAAKPLEAELRALRLRGTVVSGRFRARKLVGSGRYSKYFFAEAQCPAIMAQSRFRSRVLWRRGREAYLEGRYLRRPMQGRPAKIVRRPRRLGRRPVRPPAHPRT